MYCIIVCNTLARVAYTKVEPTLFVAKLTRLPHIPSFRQLVFVKSWLILTELQMRQTETIPHWPMWLLVKPVDHKNIQNWATQNCIAQDLNFLKDCLSYKSQPDLIAELQQENYIAKDLWQPLNLNFSCKSRPDFIAELWQEFEQTVQTPGKCLANLEWPNVKYCSYYILKSFQVILLVLARFCFSKCQPYLITEWKQILPLSGNLCTNKISDICFLAYISEHNMMINVNLIKNVPFPFLFGALFTS